MKIENITIVGGTHGNEDTGVYLINQLGRGNLQKKWSDLNIDLLLGNPKAYQQSVRFIDRDLNRSFASSELNDLSLSGYEANRAKAICQKLGAKDAPERDLIIDIHTTTSNMGITLILADNKDYNFQLAAYIQKYIPDCYIYYIPADDYSGSSEHSFLISMAPFGLAIEVGPIANGILRHDVNKKVEKVINAALEFISKKNSGVNPVLSQSVTVFKHKKVVSFPTDNTDETHSIIHEDLQDNDYKRLKKGDLIFHTIDGISFPYNDDDEDDLYPVFINEAAYYYQNIAFSLATKISVNTKTGLQNI